MVVDAELLHERLRQRLVAARARVSTRRGHVVFTLGKVRFSVQLRVSRDARTATLRGLLAEGILEARSHEGGEGSRPLPMVGAPVVSDAMVEELRAFVGRVAPDQAWGVVDARGRLDLFVDPSPVALPPLDTVRPSSAKGQRPALFSDVHQWVLKVLLAPTLPADLLHAPRGERVSSTRELASLAGVSLGSAERFLSSFQAEGYIERRSKHVVVIRHAELLEAWRQSNRPRSTPLGLAWAVAPSKPERALSGLLERLRGRATQCGLGQHAACDSLGYPFVSGTKPWIFVSDVDDAAAALREAGLFPSDAPDIFIARPQAPRSCFSGLVERGPLRVTDVIQCWLDVSWHPARGQEQAEVLWDRVLEPSFRAAGGAR